jgi:Nucleotide-diphospho-sugar transferase
MVDGKSIRKPLSTGAIAIFMLSSALAGGQVGYYIGIYAQRPLSGHVDHWEKLYLQIKNERDEDYLVRGDDDVEEDDQYTPDTHAEDLRLGHNDLSEKMSYQQSYQTEKDSRSSFNQDSDDDDDDGNNEADNNGDDENVNDDKDDDKDDDNNNDDDNNVNDDNNVDSNNDDDKDDDFKNNDDDSSTINIATAKPLLDHDIDQMNEQKMKQQGENYHADADENTGYYNAKNTESPRFPDSIAKLAVGMGRVQRDDFAKRFDTGVPLQTTYPGNEEVLIIYSHVDAQPSLMAKQTQSQGDVPLLTSVEEATANCDFVNVVLTNVDNGRRQCVALLGQTEASHIQSWMRLPPTSGYVEPSAPLRFVGRLGNYEATPEPEETRKHWDVLRHYFENIDSVMKKLRPLAERVVRNNTIVVMFSNFGQSELIANFCCSARARNLDLSSILFFATDHETKMLLKGLGLTVFYDKVNFGRLPSNAAEQFMDQTFGIMMNAKVMCLHMASLLGYDILFQDADVVWYKDPLPFFHSKELPYADADVLFADDGSPIPL